jgi:hypothetical protein
MIVSGIFRANLLAIRKIHKIGFLASIKSVSSSSVIKGSKTSGDLYWLVANCELDRKRKASC